jgi:hypothetical protein
MGCLGIIIIEKAYHKKKKLDKNFELGVVLKGEQAYQLGKIFDKLFSVSTTISIEEG